MDLGLVEKSAAAPVKRSSASADRADRAGQQSKFETSVEDFFSIPTSHSLVSTSKGLKGFSKGRASTQINASQFEV